MTRADKIASFAEELRKMTCECGQRYCVIEEMQRKAARNAKLAALERPKLTPHQADALRFIAARGGWSYAAIRTYAKDPVGTTTRHMLGVYGYLDYVSWDEGWRVTERGLARAAELEVEAAVAIEAPAWIAELVR